MRPDDMRKALTGIAPRFSYERAIADVDAADLAASPFAPQAPKMSADDLRDRMLVINADTQQSNLPSLLQRYRGDAARSWAAAAMGPGKLDALIAERGDGWYQALPQPVLVAVAQDMALLGARSSARALPSDPTAVATRIVNQPDIDDERRRNALDELNWRIKQADETRRSAESEATGQAQALTTELGTRFTSIAQIPPAIRRALPAAVIDELSRQARANIYPDQTTASDLPLVAGTASGVAPAGDTPSFDRDAQASRQPADSQFNPLAPFDGESPTAVAGSFDVGTADTDIAPTGTEEAGDGADPFAGLREQFSRFPGGGELQDASATGKLDKPSPEVVRQRAALAARWRRLTPQQRLHDPELSTPARAIEAARVLLLRRDPRLKRNLGVAALPGGKYVADMIVDELAYKVIHDSIAAGHKFPPVTDADLRPGGRHSMYLYNEIKIAAAAVLNYRQQQAWDFFTSGDHPYTKEQAAGLIAALTMENNLDPEKLQEGGGGGYGIAQWNKIRSDIFQNLTKTPLKGTTFDQQLRYVKYELDHGVYKSVGDKLRNTSTAYDAGFLITRDYEAPRDRVKTPVDRARYALEVLREFQNRPRK